LTAIPLEIGKALKLWLSAGAFVALTTHLVWINFSDIEMKYGMIVLQ
jgi:hypothetical protein